MSTIDTQDADVRAFLTQVVYDAMFDLQIRMFPDGAQKAAYVADAVLDALEAERR